MADRDVEWRISNYYAFWKYSRGSFQGTVKVVGDENTPEEIRQRRLRNRWMKFRARVSSLSENVVVSRLEETMRAQSLALERLLEDPVLLALLECEILRLDPETHECSFSSAGARELVVDYVESRSKSKSFGARLRSLFSK
jgi:hypothetical protein